MAWWKSALYDTCSIITLDKLISARVGMKRHFPRSILALNESFENDQMHRETSERMTECVSIQPLPTSSELALLLSSTSLSTALANVDTLIYATAVHFDLSVVTGDRQLGKALQSAGIKVANIPLLLRELVKSGKMTEASCERLLIAIAKKRDLILGTPNPTWDDLKKHKFPNRS